MKFLLSLAGSKHATYFRSLGLALMAFVAKGVGTRRAGAILQIHSTGYVSPASISDSFERSGKRWRMRRRSWEKRKVQI
jgi:hypothetical protein